MSMNSEVINALAPINVPVDFQTYTGTATTYITFFFFDEMGVVFAEDDEVETNYYLQVDVWSKGNYSSIVDQVKANLKAIGYIRTNAFDDYEKDTQIYHKSIRFKTTKSA